MSVLDLIYRSSLKKSSLECAWSFTGLTLRLIYSLTHLHHLHLHHHHYQFIKMEQINHAASSSSFEGQWQPLYLSCIAGASTSLGAAIVFYPPILRNSQDQDDGNKLRVPPGMMAFALALAGSVMVTVSVLSILPECLHDDSVKSGNFHMIPVFSRIMVWRICFFLLGGISYVLLSWVLQLPDPEDLLHSNDFAVLMGNESRKVDFDDDNNNHECIRDATDENNFMKERKLNSGMVLTDRNGSTTRTRKQAVKSDVWKSVPSSSATVNIRKWSSGGDLNDKEQRKAWRLAMLLFVSLLVHNFPEGLAVAASAMESPSLGITVTIGIMIHNIPEGIAIAVPCLAARPDQPYLAFILASVSGLAEPAGAFVALLFLNGIDDQANDILNLENILSFVAGIMIAVALWELFPEANRNAVATKRNFWLGTITGIVVISLTEFCMPS